MTFVPDPWASAPESCPLRQPRRRSGQPRALTSSSLMMMRKGPCASQTTCPSRSRGGGEGPWPGQRCHLNVPCGTFCLLHQSSARGNPHFSVRTSLQDSFVPFRLGWFASRQKLINVAELPRPSAAQEHPDKPIERVASTRVSSRHSSGKGGLWDALLYKLHLSNGRRAVTYGDGHHGNTAIDYKTWTWIRLSYLQGREKLTQEQVKGTNHRCESNGTAQTCESVYQFLPLGFAMQSFPGMST